MTRASSSSTAKSSTPSAPATIDRQSPPKPAGQSGSLAEPRTPARSSPRSRGLNFYTPGGFDDNTAYLATPAKTAKTLPPADSGDVDPQDFAVDPAKQEAYLARITELHADNIAPFYSG